MKPLHLLYILVNFLMYRELATNEEHVHHADSGEACWLYITLCASCFGMLAWLVYQRLRPEPTAPLRRDMQRPPPPPLTITPVPSERYVFVATNDPNIDLQPKPKGRDHG